MCFCVIVGACMSGKSLSVEPRGGRLCGVDSARGVLGSQYNRPARAAGGPSVLACVGTGYRPEEMLFQRGVQMSSITIIAPIT